MAFCSILAALCLMPATQAPLSVPPPDDSAAPSRLAPLDKASPWLARFQGAAAELQPAIARSGGEEWLAFFGGHWLSASDRARIKAALSDDALAFRRTFAAASASEFAVLGWQPAGGVDAYAAFKDRPEGDAIICWRRSGSTDAWPETAAEAEDYARHACVRVSYSIRFETPQWRAFLDEAVH